MHREAIENLGVGAAGQDAIPPVKKESAILAAIRTVWSELTDAEVQFSEYQTPSVFLIASHRGEPQK
jgi:hypothetical protein